jgi:hypothetical protein
MYGQPVTRFIFRAPNNKAFDRTDEQKEKEGRKEKRREEERRDSSRESLVALFLKVDFVAARGNHTYFEIFCCPSMSNIKGKSTSRRKSMSEFPHL